MILEVLPISASLDLHLEVTKKMNVLATASRHNREALSKLGNRFYYTLENADIYYYVGIPHLILTRFHGILSENFEQSVIPLEIEDAKDKKEDPITRKKKELQKQLLLLLQTVGTNSYVTTIPFSSEPIINLL